MPIIANNTADTDAAAQGLTPVVAPITVSPKEFNQFLTGNGVRQGLLKNDVFLNGAITYMPHHIYNQMVHRISYDSDGKVCKGATYNYGTGKNDEFSTLYQTISILAPEVLPINDSYGHVSIPLKDLYDLMNEDLCEIQDAAGNTTVVKCNIGISKIYAYKAINNYVIADLYAMLISPDGEFNHIVTTHAMMNHDTVADLFDAIDKTVNSVVFSKAVKITKSNVTTIKNAYMATRTMYDILCDEMKFIKTDNLKTILKTLSLHYNSFKSAVLSLNNVDLTFMKYQDEIIGFINQFTRQEQLEIYNQNMSASLANTLASLGQNVNAKIPELVGKTYKTNKIRLTPEQLNAIQSEYRTTIVAAGAGTGKSSSINHRLAFMSENGCDMKKTYVLSFTKAAANHIKKLYKDCESSTIADFTHRFVESYFGKKMSIINNVDLVKKINYLAENLANAGANKNIIDDIYRFTQALSREEEGNADMLALLDPNLCSNAGNILAVLNKLNMTSLVLDPIIFATQLNSFKPNIDHIIIDEAQDSNELEFLNILKLAINNNISLYVVGDCAQTLYEFRNANPKILNNLTKLFKTYDLSVNHRSTQIILDIANLISSTMQTHKTKLISNNIMKITQQEIDNAISIQMFKKSNDAQTQQALKDYVDKHIGSGESIAIIARASKDVINCYNFLTQTYPNNTVINITSARNYDSTVLTNLADMLDGILPASKQLTGQNLKNTLESNALQLFNRNAVRKNQAPAANCRVFDGWAANQDFNDWATKLMTNRTTELLNLKDSLLNEEIRYNITKQRVVDAKNVKLKQQKADIIVSTIHGVKGLEYDHVACFIDDGITSNNDTNKRISYVALTRAKLTECIFCTHDKFVKKVEQYHDSMPDANALNTNGADSTDDSDPDKTGETPETENVVNETTPTGVTE